MAYESLYGLRVYGEDLYSKSEDGVWLAYTDNPALAHIQVGNTSSDLIVGWGGVANITVTASSTVFSRVYSLEGLADIIVDMVYDPYIGPFWVAIPSIDQKWNVIKPNIGNAAWASRKPIESEWRPVNPNARYPYP
jgi:hypothetical protein